VKRSGRNESICVVIHICIDTTQGISLYSYPHLEVAKMPCFSYYLLCFFFNKFGEQEGGTGSARWGGGSDAIMYTHLNKCKNNIYSSTPGRGDESEQQRG
jgi:hypothetical protein